MLLIVLAIGVPSAFAILYMTPRTVEDRYHEVMLGDVAFLSNRLNLHLTKSLQDVEIISSMVKLSDIEDASDKVDLFLKTSGIFTGGIITNSEGRLIYFYSSPRGVVNVDKSHNLSYRDYVQQPLKNNTPYLSNVIVTEGNSNPVIFASSPLMEQGEAVGVLALTINLWNDKNLFFTLFNSFRDNKKGNIYVIDEEATIIYHHDTELVGKKLDYTVSDRIIGAGEGLIKEIAIGDVKKAVAFSNLEINNWAVIYEIDHSSIYSINRLGFIMAIGTMILVLLLGLLASSVFAKIILKPLAEITTATEQVAGGDLSRQIENRGHRDFLPLIKNFNIMIKNLRFQYEELEKLSLQDYQTGLANRRYFDQHLKQELERAQRKGHVTSLMILDIDNFKDINDQFGHLTGDKAIVALAAVLKDCLRSQDLPVRYGGDEFLVLLPETSLQQSEAVAKKLKDALKEVSINTRKGSISFTTSIGVVSTEHYPQTTSYNEKTINNFLRKADTALYQAKIKGRDRIELYIKEN